MKAQVLTQVSVRTNPESEEAVCAVLERVFGTTPSVYYDARTCLSTASVYVEAARSQLRPELAQLRVLLAEPGFNDLERGSKRLRLSRVRREEWAESWKRHFLPLDIGGRLLIKPSWSRRRSRRGQVVVVLDPGLSFGTGQHATTAFCLRQLVALRGEVPQSFGDIGTGSGILAIAAAKLGYRPVVGFDIDPDAVRVARQNAEANHVSRLVQLRRQDVLCWSGGNRQFELICANLTGDLLLAALPQLVPRLAAAGTLVLAGVLRQEFRLLHDACRNVGLKLKAHRAEKEWKSGAFVHSA